MFAWEVVPHRHCGGLPTLAVQPNAFGSTAITGGPGQSVVWCRRGEETHPGGQIRGAEVLPDRAGQGRAALQTDEGGARLPGRVGAACPPAFLPAASSSTPLYSPIPCSHTHATVRKRAGNPHRGNALGGFSSRRSLSPAGSAPLLEAAGPGAGGRRGGRAAAGCGLQGAPRAVPGRAARGRGRRGQRGACRRARRHARPGTSGRVCVRGRGYMRVRRRAAGSACVQTRGTARCVHRCAWLCAQICTQSRVQTCSHTCTTLTICVRAAMRSHMHACAYRAHADTHVCTRMDVCINSHVALGLLTGPSLNGPGFTNSLGAAVWGKERAQGVLSLAVGWWCSSSETPVPCVATPQQQTGIIYYCFFLLI